LFVDIYLIKSQNFCFMLRAATPDEKRENMARHHLRTWGLLLAGGCAGALLAGMLRSSGLPDALADQPQAKLPDLATVAADVEVLKGKATDQSHVMQDVAYHFTNLWFAGQHENWDLADFYWSEAISHLHWAVRVIPIRKDKAGREVKLADILQALENSPLKQLGVAIKAKDKSAFEKAYRFTLEGCYACHKAVDKPYLHPQVPTESEVHIINFDPKADWPK
jgi:hypothetical protein